MNALRSSLSLSIAALLLPALASAQSTMQLPRTNNGFFDRLVVWMQALVDFITGPYALLFTIVGLATCFTLWVMSPKEGMLSIALRVVSASIGFLTIVQLVLTIRGG